MTTEMELAGPVEEPTLQQRAARILNVGTEEMALAAALAVLSDTSADCAVRRGVLGRSDIPLEAVRASLNDRDDSVRAYAVGLEVVPFADVRRVERDVAWQVRAELARRADCPLEVLERLSSDPDAIVRRSAIAHAGVGNAVLLRVLTRGKSRLDAELAAGHPSLDVQAHEKELLQANAFGAMALLRRSDLPGSLLARFVSPSYPVNVRVAAVKHDCCPAAVVGAAVRDDVSAEVRQAAAGRSQCPPEDLLIAAGDSPAEVRRAVAANESAPPAAIRLLMSDADELVRRDACKSGHADPGHLAHLVKTDPDAKVRKAALANRLCPSSTVDAACSDPELVFTAAGNPSCTREGDFAALVTVRLMPRQAGRGAPDPEQRQRDRVRSLAQKAIKRVQKAPWEWLAAHPLEMLNPADLEAVIGKHLFDAAGDGREVVRMAVASHPKSDVTVLMALSNDPSEAVRKAVSARILDAVDGGL